MSRGRPRHQASRRRTYSPRQREVRQREGRDRHGRRDDERYWLTDSVAAIDIERGADLDAASWSLSQRRSSAA